MSWLRLALANLFLSPLTSLVNILLMALGTASIALLILAGQQLSETLTRDARGLDLVVGAKGSPAQLILSAVYHADLPPGNIALADARPWAEDSRVSLAAPLALGDSFRGFRIVGTTPEYLELLNASLARGRVWQEPMQAVIGAAVARASGLRLGEYFSGAHGFSGEGRAHDTRPYRVVGILKASGAVVDRLVLTSLQSVWTLHGHGEPAAAAHDSEHGDELEHEHEGEFEHEREDELEHGHEGEFEHEHEDELEHGHEDELEHGHENELEHGHGDELEHGHENELEHGHEDEFEHELEAGREHDSEHEPGGQAAHRGEQPDLEITAMLLRYRTPLAAMSLPREINAVGALQAAAPALEIARLLQLIGLGMDGLRAFAWVLIVTACLSVFAALYGSLSSRRGDLAMLRCLGATRGELFLALLSEGLLLSVAGITLGYVLAHGAMGLLGAWLEASRGVALSPSLWVDGETALLAALLLVSAISAAIPAYQAYRTDVARTLAEGG